MSNKHILSALDPHSAQPGPPHLSLLSGAKCFCPPSCTNTQYFATHSQATFPNKASRVMEELRKREKYEVVIIGYILELFLAL